MNTKSTDTDRKIYFTTTTTPTKGLIVMCSAPDIPSVVLLTYLVNINHALLIVSTDILFNAEIFLVFCMGECGCVWVCVCVQYK